MRTARSFAAVFALALALALPAVAQERAPLEGPSPEELASLVAFVEERMAEEPSAGLSVAFWLDGEVWARGFGYRDLEKELPATADTSYRMASVTKPFTAVAALQLVEAGKLDLDADVRRYVPYFPKKRWPVTTRHLLGHLAGVSHYRFCSRECHLTTHHTTRQAIDIFARWPLEHEPGTAYKYTSYGYNLVGAAVEGASGLGYGPYLQRFVFGPAGMTRSALETHDAVFHERAKGYQKKGGRLVPSEIIDISSRFAGGGTRSTVKDMVAFGAAYIDGKLLSEDSKRQLEASMSTRDGVLTDYGMGFAVIPQSGRWVLAHGGGQQETSTLLILYPAERFAVALAANVEGYALALHDVKERLVSVVLGDGGARRPLAGDDEQSAVLARALSGLMSHGVAYYKRWGQGATASPRELIAAFASLDELLAPERIKSEPAAALARARLADDPVGGRVYPRAGAHMAGTIARHRGHAALRRYHDDAPFAFVLDYAAACEALSCPPPFRLSPAVVEAAGRHGRAYARANSDAVRELRITPTTEPAAVQALLERSFKGASIHPDLSLELKRAADVAAARGDEARARALLEVGLAHHPLSTRLLAAVAQQRLVEGHLEEAAELLARAHQVDEGAKDPALLDRLAEAAAKEGKREVAIAALRAAEEAAPSAKRRGRLEQLLRAGR